LVKPFLGHKITIKGMTNIRSLLAYNMKNRRQILGISQAKLAEKVKTSTHYIGQIELGNKFPSPEMLERIALSLEIDTPQLFSMDSFTEDTLKRFKEGVIADVGMAITTAVDSRLSEFKRLG
jgi:transcriptional regulator with XRE-family HTH domain